MVLFVTFEIVVDHLVLEVIEKPLSFISTVDYSVLRVNVFIFEKSWWK